MSEGLNDKIASAKEMFMNLENSGAGQVAELARRAFYIQDRLAAKSA